MARKILVASMAAVAISGTALAADLSYRARRRRRRLRSSPGQASISA